MGARKNKGKFTWRARPSPARSGSQCGEWGGTSEGQSLKSGAQPGRPGSGEPEALGRGQAEGRVDRVQGWKKGERTGGPARCSRLGWAGSELHGEGRVRPWDSQSIPGTRPGHGTHRPAGHTAPRAGEMKNNRKPMRPELPEFIPGRNKRKQFSPWRFSFLSFTKQTQLCLLKTSVGRG